MSRVLWRQLKIIDKKERRMLKERNPLIKSKVQPLVDNIEEKAYILLLISATLADGDMKVKLNAKLDVLGQDIDKGNNIDVDLDKKINTTSKLLTNSLLAAKFIQGIPILGAMGAMVNFNILRKVGKYSSLKYKKRFLLKKARNIIRDISL